MGGAQASGAATALLGPASLSLEKDSCGLENRTTRKETAAGMRLVLHVLEKLQTGFKYFHGGGGRHIAGVTLTVLVSRQESLLSLQPPSLP